MWVIIRKPFYKCFRSRAVCKTCMPPIWAVSCSGSHCVNTLSLVVMRGGGGPETILLCRVTVTLTFDLVTSRSIGVICRWWPMSLWSFMIPGLRVLELSSKNHFTASGHCDLDLLPSDLKINRGHLPVMTNVPMKFHDPRPKISWVNIRKPFYCFRSLWPWPLT